MTDIQKEKDNIIDFLAGRYVENTYSAQQAFKEDASRILDLYAKVYIEYKLSQMNNGLGKNEDRSEYIQ